MNKQRACSVPPTGHCTAEVATQTSPRLALKHPPRAFPVAGSGSRHVGFGHPAIDPEPTSAASAAAQPAVEPEPAPALEGVVRGGVVPRIPASRYVADFGARVLAATGALQSASPAAFAAGQSSPLPGTYWLAYSGIRRGPESQLRSQTWDQLPKLHSQPSCPGLVAAGDNLCRLRVCLRCHRYHA